MTYQASINNKLTDVKVLDQKNSWFHTKFYLVTYTEDIDVLANKIGTVRRSKWITSDELVESS